MLGDIMEKMNRNLNECVDLISLIGKAGVNGITNFYIGDDNSNFRITLRSGNGDGYSYNYFDFYFVL